MRLLATAAVLGAATGLVSRNPRVRGAIHVLQGRSTIFGVHYKDGAILTHGEPFLVSRCLIEQTQRPARYWEPGKVTPPALTFVHS